MRRTSRSKKTRPPGRGTGGHSPLGFQIIQNRLQIFPIPEFPFAFPDFKGIFLWQTVYANTGIQGQLTDFPGAAGPLVNLDIAGVSRLKVPVSAVLFTKALEG